MPFERISTLPVAALAYVALWTLAAAGLSAGRPGAWLFPTLVLAVFAALTTAAWLATRRLAIPLPALVRSPRHAWITAAYIAVFGIVFVGWLFSWVRTLATGQQQAVAMLLLKVTTMAAIPLLLLAAFGASPRALVVDRWLPRRLRPLAALLCVAVLVVMALATPALAQLQSLAPAISVLAWAVPLNATWVFLEAALCEEILFRVFLQTQLETWMRPSTALVVGAIVFAVAHVPGLWLRGDPSMNTLTASDTPSLLWSTAYAIAVLSPPALLFGLLWSRTRSLGLIVLVHTAINFLPTLPGFIGVWAAP